MLSLVYIGHFLQMHNLILYLVSIVTFYILPAYADPPPPSFEFIPRPTVEKLDIKPVFANLFQSGFQSQSEPSVLNFTGISASGATTFAHFKTDDTHLYAMIGEILPDGSRLVSIDLTMGNITTNKNNIFTTYSLAKYD